ncbi:MAG: hypothetical protein GX184_07360 [Clostridiaceae bacterium]|nr:hypothetical protein [Clostridiaceae bacterium]
MRSIKVIIMLILVAALALSIPCNSIFAASSNTGGEEPIKGVVKDNNPSLGYITLYFEDGSGTQPDKLERLISIRTFTYGYDVVVTRDGYTTIPESIQPGDQVFIKLDSDGYIQKISAQSFYRPVYGRIQNKGYNWITIKKDGGTYGYYPLTNYTPIYKNGKPGSMSDLLPGEKVKILVQTDGINIDIASIDVEKNPRLVTGVYRGTVEFYDSMRDSLVVSNIQEFVNGYWINSPFIGIQRIRYSEELRERPMPRVSGMAYFATQKASDGTDRIVAAAFRSGQPYTSIFRDTLMGLAGGRMELQNSSEIIRFDEKTIAIKDQRLVDISNINTLDSIKVSAERAGSGYLANVLVCDSINNNGLTVYRGRIKDVVKHTSITVESFAQLDGVTWEFTNTPKTFDIELGVTRFLNDSGIGNIREFDSSYKGQTVYIVAQGTKIQLISTAPYADSPASGRITELNGATYDSSGQLLADYTNMVITDTMIYDVEESLWKAGNDTSIDIPVHAIVLKDGKVGSTSLLKTGDEIKVIRHAQNLEGILIICD